MYLFLYVILSFPVVISFYFSDGGNVLWLISSLLFLFMVSFSILSLSAQIRKKYLAYIFSLVPLSLIFIVELIQLISFYLQGKGFNDRFFFHLNWNTLQETWAAYPSLTFMISITFLFLCINYY
jgi:hypothetical protein